MGGNSQSALSTKSFYRRQSMVSSTLGKGYPHTLQLPHRQTKLAFPFDPEISYSS